MSKAKHWQDRLTRAQFRGFEFLTDDHDAKSGRRLVVHEFPGAEEPFVEDLGGKAWDYKLSAYFIGADYDLERNGFLEKLNEPGADWLMHPWLGALWVRAQHWSLRESNDKGAYCALAIEFVPGGLAPFSVTVDKVEVAFDRTRRFADAVVDDFVDAVKKEPNFLNGMLAKIDAALDFVRDLVSLATLPLTWANQILRMVGSVKGMLGEILGFPDAYASAYRSLTGLFGRSGNSADFADTERPRLVARLAASASGFYAYDNTADEMLAGEAMNGNTPTISTPPVTTSPTTPPSETDGQPNTESTPESTPGVDLNPQPTQPSTPPNISTQGEAVGSLQRTQALLDAFHGRLLVALVAEAALVDYRLAEDRDAVLASIVQAVDALLPSLPDPLFHAALEMRTAVIDALLAQDLTYREHRAVALPLPAVVLAHRLDVAADDFLTINRVRHPLFVRGNIRA